MSLGDGERPNERFDDESSSHSTFHKHLLQTNKEYRDAERRRRQAESGAPEQWGPAKNPFAEILTDERAAPRLAERHNAQLISEPFIEAMWDARSTVLEEKVRGITKIEQIRELTGERGFFMKPYTDDLMKKRLTRAWTRKEDPKTRMTYCIIAEASGLHPDPANPLHLQRLPMADCQILLPPPTSKRSTDEEPLFVEGVDAPENEDLIRYLSENPYAVAVIDDIVSDERMAKRGLASVALNKALTELVKEGNENRNGYPIRYVGAWIASLQGLEFPDGSRTMLQDDIGITPIPNGRSTYLFDHFKSPHCTGGFQSVCVQRNREVPYVISEGQLAGNYKLIVNWAVKVAALKMQRA